MKFEKEKIKKIIEMHIRKNNEKYLNLIKSAEPLVEEYKNLKFNKKLSIILNGTKIEKAAAILSMELGIKTYSDLNILMKICSYEKDPVIKSLYISVISKIICRGAMVGKDKFVRPKLTKKEINSLKEFYFSLLMDEDYYVRDVVLSSIPSLPFKWKKGDMFYPILRDYLFTSSYPEWRTKGALAISRMYKDFTTIYEAFHESENSYDLLEPLIYCIKGEEELARVKSAIAYLEDKYKYNEEVLDKLFAAKFYLKLYSKE